MKSILTTAAAFALLLGVSHGVDDAKAAAEAAPAKAECAKKDGAKKECPASACADKVVLSVAGMTCGGCENKLKTALTAVEGVTVNQVCSKSGKACLQFDEEKVSRDDISAAIARTGFRLQGEQVSIDVTGMTCGGCASKVKTAITAVEGVSDGKVCHQSGKATVTFDPAKTSKDRIVAAINTTRFKTK